MQLPSEEIQCFVQLPSEEIFKMQKKALSKMSRCIYDLYPDFMPTATVVHGFNIKVNSKYRLHKVNVIVHCVQKKLSNFLRYITR